MKQVIITLIPISLIKHIIPIRNFHNPSHPLKSVHFHYLFQFILACILIVAVSAAPNQQYGGGNTQSSYGSSSSSYGAPAQSQSYTVPTQQYNSQPVSYVTPQVSYVPPVITYSQPAVTYTSPNMISVPQQTASYAAPAAYTPSASSYGSGIKMGYAAQQQQQSSYSSSSY
jgi:hypothetical protein